MAKVAARQVGAEICTALGLNPENVQQIDIHFGLDDAVVNVIRRYVEDSELDEIQMVLKRETWVLAKTEQL